MCYVYIHSLDGNSIGDEGVKILLETLKLMTALQELKWVDVSI